MMKKTTFGYQIRTVGTNASHAEFVGINPKTTFIKTMMFSGALRWSRRCDRDPRRSTGNYLDNFAAGVGFNGMLTALIVKNNLVIVASRVICLRGAEVRALGSGAAADDERTQVYS